MTLSSLQKLNSIKSSTFASMYHIQMLQDTVVNDQITKKNLN